MNHLQVERLSFVNVVQVFHGDDEAELQDGQAWEHGQISLQILIRHVLRGLSLSPCSMFALASVKQSLLASSRSDVLMVGLETETLLRQNIWREEIPESDVCCEESKVRKTSRTSRTCSERKSLLELKCLWKTSCTDLSSHRLWKTCKRYNPCRERRFFCRLGIIGPTHLHTAVPVPRKPFIDEVPWQAELGSDPLQVLRECRAVQQVDLTVREARFNPFLQQLQNILEEDGKSGTSDSRASWTVGNVHSLTSLQVKPTTATGAWADWETSSRL